MYNVYLKVFSSEELNAHDGKDQPEDETHQEYVEDGRYRLY